MSAAAPRPLPTADELAPPAARLARTRRRALLVGVAGTLLAAAGLLVDPDQVARGWLVAVVLATGVASGCLALALLHLLTGGAWGLVVRRPLEAAAGTLPLLALLFAPLLLALPRLYPWARPEQVADDPVLQHRAAWSTPALFTGRLALYFALWIGSTLLVAWLLRRQAAPDASPRARSGRALRNVAAPALALWVLAATFAAVDWLMSLEPRWTSSLFGVAFLSGSVLSALAFVILVTGWLAPHPPLSGRLLPRHLHDLGKLLLAFVLVFAYFAFSQFLLIWSADLPDEVTFYLERARGVWAVVAAGVALLHFGVPFVVLLGRRAKRSRRLLVRVALVLLVMRWVDLQWHVQPTAADGGALLHPLDLASAAGVGGLFTAAFAWQLGRRPLLPESDPGLGAALADD